MARTIVKPSFINPNNQGSCSSHTNSVPLETAAKLLAETAHSLRLPLSGIRQSAQWINDGYLGPTTAEQKQCLEALLHQVDGMQHVIADVLSVDQVRRGFPRVHPQWVDSRCLQSDVMNAIDTVFLQSGVDLRWEMPAGITSVYADSAKLTRLLLNLIGNALQSTGEAAQILVRCEPVEKHGTLRFVVIDHSQSDDPAWSARFASNDPHGGRSRTLALTISSQLAALHGSHLEIDSRPGEGTRIAFELPAAGPTSVADAWFRWRQRFVKLRVRPARRSQNLRIDPPQPHQRNGDSQGNRSTVADSFLIAYDGQPPLFPNGYAAVCIHVGPTVPSQTVARFGYQLQESMRMYELSYRTNQRQWVVLLDADADLAQERLTNFQRFATNDLLQLRWTWTPPTMIPLHQHSGRSKLRELLVRDSLHNCCPLGNITAPRSQAGSPMPAISLVATRRLESELRRLATRMSKQSHQLKAQADGLRG